MISVQAAGCAPIVRAWQGGNAESAPWQEARTIAAGLRVPQAFADYLILRTIRESGGTAVAVTDDEIMECIGEVARLERIVDEALAEFAPETTARKG